MRLQHLLRSASVVLVGVAVLLLTSCGSDSSGSSDSTNGSDSATSTSRPGCADAVALRTSLKALTEVQPLQDGLDALNAAIDDVKTNLDAALASAGDDLQPDVEQVKTAFTELQTVMSGVTADNIGQQVPAILTALEQVGTSAATLATVLTDRCPSG